MPKNIRQIAATESDFDDIAREILSKFPASTYRIWLLNGPLGAGKTTLIRALAKHLGVRTRITSPTFALMVSHPLAHKRLLHHIDLYRIRKTEELGPMGLFDALLDEKSICAIEWPNNFMRIFSGMPSVRITIVPKKNSRDITIEGITPAAQKRRTRQTLRQHHQR